MKKIMEWLNAHWGILVAVWAAIIAAIFVFGAMQLGDRIQATTTITLVFITLFYAIQTQRLVDEERKGRSAEFGIQRIEELLRPLIEILDDLYDNLSVITEPRDRALIDKYENYLGNFQVRLNFLDKLLFDHLYMASNRLRNELSKFLRETRESIPTIDNQAETYTIPWKEKVEKRIRELQGTIVVEAGLISQYIRKAYGYDSQNANELESWDDLTVLSNRPPSRI